MTVPTIAILGGGPAGVGAAYKLQQTGRAHALLIEAQDVVGGTAGSFYAFGQHLDYGSHRLHHAVDPEILSDIQSLLRDDLRDRPRHGRIRLRGKWLHFPLKPVDLLLRLDRRFAIGTLTDMLSRKIRRLDEGDTFASVLAANLGSTICDHFYFPYARKIWGVDPSELSGMSARKRVSAGSFKRLIGRLLKPPGGGRFFYPRRGYGQISEAYADAARDLGADIRLNHRVVGLESPRGDTDCWRIKLSSGESTDVVEADFVWSTLPTTVLPFLIDPPAPDLVRRAATAMQFRSMVLVYLQLDVDQFTTTDAHYFPETPISMTRLSEPKNYWGSDQPKGYTVLCAELPCTMGDATWNMQDTELAALVTEDLARAGLPLERPPIGVLVRKIARAYPIYLTGYEKPMGTLEAWTSQVPRLLVYGRQGLFAHDNLHHALFMAYSAVDCLNGGSFDTSKWDSYRKIFATHVVED